MTATKTRTGPRTTAFQRMASEWLPTVGAVPDPTGRHQFVFPTDFGPLGVTVYEDWVACRFHDLARAASVPAINRWCGKWNHHFPKWPAADAFRRLVQIFNEVIPN